MSRDTLFADRHARAVERECPVLWNFVAQVFAGPVALSPRLSALSRCADALTKLDQEFRTAMERVVAKQPPPAPITTLQAHPEPGMTVDVDVYQCDPFDRVCPVCGGAACTGAFSATDSHRLAYMLWKRRR